MSFMRKILDALKMESTREMENTADNLAKHKEMSISEAYSEIGRASILTDSENILIAETEKVMVNVSDPTVENNQECNYGKNDTESKVQREPFTENISMVPEDEIAEKEKKPLGHKTELGNIAMPEDKLKPFKYIFPPVELLDKKQDSENGMSEVEQCKVKLKRTFEVFGIKADIVNILQGARFTRFEIQIGKGVRIKDILKIEDDIKLNLEAANIHIEAPIPGRTTIGIDVENKELFTVSFMEIIESKVFSEFPSNLAVAIGKDIAGNVIVESLENMCHLLVGGTTGSGKSVCINSIIMSILYKADPSEVKLVLIDTKAVNLYVYNGIPHLMIPVVTDLKKASAVLNWGTAEMDDRYRKFSHYGVRDLENYNKAAEKCFTTDKSLKKLPSIVIIIDDFSDLMIGYKNEVEENVCRLAQMGRACGIHLIISTQRPSVDVITGIIKANIPSRIAFNVFSAIDSRTMLDVKGAEKLLGDGDMLFYPQGQRTPLRVQGTFVSDEEIENVIHFVKKQTLCSVYGDDIEKRIEKIQYPYSYLSGASEYSGIDELFEKAGRFVIEQDKASIGLLQRYLKIGFNRAARIMEQLEDAGVVGPEPGTKPRMIIMSMEEFAQYIKESL